MATEKQKAGGPADDSRIDEVSARIRDLNERILGGGQTAGLAFLDAYEKALTTVADLQDRIGRANPIEALSAIAHMQAQFTRDLAEAYTAAARRFLAERR